MDDNRYGFRDSDFARPEKNRKGGFSSRAKAILIFLPPTSKQFSPVHIRSMLYNFHSPDFIDRGRRVLEDSGRGQYSVDSISDTFLRGLDANSHIMPSLSPSGVFNAQRLSDRYRFVLILTEDGSDRLLSNTRIRSGTVNGRARRIYTGICSEDPINKMSFGGNRSLNRECVLEITKKTVTEVRREDTARGSITKLRNAFSDELVNPSLTNTLRSSEGTHLMLPELVSQGIVQTGSGMATASGMATDISQARENIIFSESLEDPRRHFKTVVRAFSLANDDKNANDRVSGYRSLTIDDDISYGDDMANERVSNYLSVPVSGKISESDLDLHSEVTLGEIDDSFDPEVETFDIEDSLMYDTADQREKSLINQFSYLIAVVTPAILASIGFNAINFTYAIERTRGPVPDEMFRIKSSETIYDVGHADRRDMEGAFKSEIRNACLNHIFKSIGDFHLVCECDATGFTTIRLNPVELGIRNDVDFEIPTLLGGNISPMIGDDVDSATNTDNLADLWGTMMGHEVRKPWDSDDDYPDESVPSSRRFADELENPFASDDEPELED